MESLKFLRRATLKQWTANTSALVKKASQRLLPDWFYFTLFNYCQFSWYYSFILRYFSNVVVVVFGYVVLYALHKTAKLTPLVGQ